MDHLLDAYRAELADLRGQSAGVRDLPAVDFFLFGMGNRRKLLYQDGRLQDASTGELIREWSGVSSQIIPPAYTVVLTDADGNATRIVEDAVGVWIEDSDGRTLITSGPVNLPDFKGHRYPLTLRVLHHEILVNIVDGALGIPNLFVYKKPWYRDGAMMAMVLEKTDNLDLVRDWILRLREPFDRNNSGETEADNLGQVLYLLSLASDRSHSLVSTILDLLPKFEKSGYIVGRSDFAEHPVYQTKWAKFGLSALGLDDPYPIPTVRDSYSALVWWAYRDQRVEGESFNGGPMDYPYLGWAEAHFSGGQFGWISAREYPLSWESKASQANYSGMAIISPEYVDQKMCAPHTWHAAEMFLYLYEFLSWA